MEETREDLVESEMFLDERLHVRIGLPRSRRRFFPIDRLSDSMNRISLCEKGKKQEGQDLLREFSNERPVDRS